MPVDPSSDPLAGVDAASLARAAARADARLDVVIADCFMEEALRPNEETRAAIGQALDVTVRGLTDVIAPYAARLLAATAPAAATWLAAAPNSLPRLIGSGALADRTLMRGIVDEARVALLDAALVATRAPEDAPVLLARLAEHRDPLVRDHATAFLLADNRRRRADAPAPELAPAIEQRFAWLVAAALVEGCPAPHHEITAAVIEATTRHLAAQDAERQAGVAAARLAAALDLAAAERGAALIDALVEGRVRLFAALLGQATGLELDDVMTATLDTDPAVLLALLRAAGVTRDDAAHIGLRLAEADRRRDAEALADAVDAAAGMTREDAAAAIRPLTLARDYRAAARTLAQGRS